MGLHTELHHTTVLTPTERERRKSPQHRAEDVIYTLNHTFTCLTLTDLLVVPILRGFGFNIGHVHGDHDDHSYVQAPTPADLPKDIKSVEELFKESARMTKAGGHAASPGLLDAMKKNVSPEEAPVLGGNYRRGGGHAHSHAPASKGTLWERIRAEVKQAVRGLHWKDWKGAGKWFGGEIIGDVGAAFVTIPVQRFFPGFMQGIRNAVEPLVGGFFHRGANRAAHKWADKHGLGYDNQEVIARAQEIYDYELRHLPQMVVWTASSVVLHYGAMKVMEKGITIGEFGRAKAAGAGITAGLVFGARALAPDKAHKWDETAGKHVVVPLTKTVGKLFGVKERDVDDFHARQAENDNDAPAKSWADRVKASPPTPAVETVRS